LGGFKILTNKALISDGSVLFKNVYKNFSGVQVFKGIDLTVKSGEVLALLGQSGSGKTTLLRCVNGLEVIQKGIIEVGGLAIQDPINNPGSLAKNIAKIRQSIGIVFQQFNLFPHMTVMENVCVAQIKVLGRSEDEARDRARTLLDRVGLLEKSESRPLQLSGGQQQRVAIARTLAMDPRVLLLDEVTSSLDPQMTNDVLRVISDVSKDGITLIIVTHEMGFARHVANRAVFMHEGVIAEDAPSEQLFENPQNENTKKFLAAVLSHE
jgi:ABC-type polar amino acid transport system ATPase subunit